MQAEQSAIDRGGLQSLNPPLQTPDKNPTSLYAQAA
jgi:hypothetical protein